MTRVPALPAAVPKRGRHFLKGLGQLVLGASGWAVEGNFPDLGKFIVIAAPHTSNWDFVIGMSAALAIDIDAHWIGKHTIFRWPVGPAMRKLGGIPVDRRHSVGLVPQVVSEILSHDRFVVAIAPEGTRKKVERWKSGFYHMARQAQVPIVCAYFDYSRKKVGIGRVMYPSGDFENDIDELMAYYSQFRGKHHTD